VDTRRCASGPSTIYRFSLRDDHKSIMADVGESKDKNVVVSPTMGLFRSAQEAAQLGDDCTGKTFVITGAYSGIGV
jgi:hypothetical protein